MDLKRPYRNLNGRGYEAFEGVCQAIDILSLGKVIELLCKEKEFSPELYGLLKKIAVSMNHMDESKSYPRTFTGHSLEDKLKIALNKISVLL